MFELLLALTAVVLGSGTVIAYQRTRDLLHPLLFLGPLFAYSCVLEPWLVRDDLGRFFAYAEDVQLVLVLNLLAVTGLVVGALHHLPRAERVIARRALLQGSLQHRERVKLQRIALVLSLVSLTAYAYGIANSGGFVAAFSRVKGGGHTESGYILEAMNLGLVGAAMVAISYYRRGWTASTILFMAVALLPNLVQGSFGGRRGPLFMALAAAMFAWLMVRPKPPKLPVLACVFACVLLAVAFVWSQRQHLYLSSPQAEVNWADFVGALTHDEVDESNNFVYGAGFVLAAHHSGSFTWGRRIVVNALVRPVPKQLWPTKYEDVGATWVTNQHPGLGHMSASEWLAAVGWIPPLGSAAICISDLFGEFGWGAILALYVIGRGFAGLRVRSRIRGGMWDLLYLEALMLSIFLATQSFSAFYHRYLILAIPTLLAWKWVMQRDSRSTSLALRYRPGRALPHSRAVAR